MQYSAAFPVIHDFSVDPNSQDRLVLFDAEDDAGYADAVDVFDVIRRAAGRIGVGFGNQARNTRTHD